MLKNLSGYSIAITGASGWLGQALIASIPKDVPIVTFTSSDIHELKHLPRGKWILAHFGYLTMERQHAATYRSLSDSLTDEVCLAITRIQPEAIFFPSSGAVYRKGNIYGEQKLKDEVRFKVMADMVGAKIIIPRIFNMSGHFINKVKDYAIGDMILGAMDGRIVVNSPLSRRSYTHVDDILLVCFRWLLEGEPAAPFDTCGEILNMRELASVVGQVVGIPHAKIIGSGKRIDYIGNSQPISMVFNRFGIKPKDIEEQVYETYYYLRRYHEGINNWRIR